MSVSVFTCAAVYKNNGNNRNNKITMGACVVMTVLFYCFIVFLEFVCKVITQRFVSA